jgi:lipopolysaccharide transport system permease protein
LAQPKEAHRISPDSPSLRAQLRELASARDLFWLLLGREVRVRYKQTVLGAAWVVLQPLLPALIFALVFGTFARLPSGGTPYLLFAFTGLVVYGLFASSASRAATSFLRDGQLVTKVYFPRSLLPLAAGTGALVDFAVGLAILAVLLVVFGAIPGPAVLMIPVFAAMALGLGLGLGLAVAALSAHYRDFAIALPFALQVLLYASPVVYSIELLPSWVHGVYGLNPMVLVIDAFRWAVLGTPPPTLAVLVAGLAVGTVAITLGLLVFSRATRDLTDVI